jgi:hypothetical protein
MSFFNGKIKWSEGLYLSPEHLNEENKYIENSIKNIKNIMNNYENVINFKINEILLSRGVLEIMEFQCMCANFQYIEYHMDWPVEILSNGDKSGTIYEIREDLNKFAKIIMDKGLIFYLCIQPEEFIVLEAIHNNTDVVHVEKIIPKIVLLPEHLIRNTNTCIPVVRIISDKGGFILDPNYIYPITQLKQNTNLYNLLEAFIKFLRNKAVEMASGFFTKSSGSMEETIIAKLNYSLQYNSIMPEILVLESLLYNEQHPFQIFISLQKIVGYLSLIRFTNLPSCQSYTHYDIYKSISNLIDIITQMVNYLKIDGERLQFHYTNKRFNLLLPLEVFLANIKTYLLIEMDNENEKDTLINWIEDARICDASSEEIINTERVRGLERKIFNTESFGNNIIIVTLNMNSRYLISTNANLIIYNTYSNYLPKNIVLYWRNSSL